MYDIANIKTRYFKTKIGDKTLDIEPPKLKVLRKFEKLNKDENQELEEVINIMVIVLSKNKQGFKVSNKFVEENFDIHQMGKFLDVYFNWVGEIEKK